MNLFYTFVPVTNRQMLYPIGGQGLRPKVNLENYFGQILDRLWQIRCGELVIPLGLLLFFFGIGALLWLFSRTRTGMIFAAIAENERFVKLSGIHVDHYRTIAIIMSTVIAAIGVVVYSQSYGILHLYDGPFMMSFPGGLRHRHRRSQSQKGHGGQRSDRYIFIPDHVSSVHPGGQCPSDPGNGRDHPYHHHQRHYPICLYF